MAEPFACKISVCCMSCVKCEVSGLPLSRGKRSGLPHGRSKEAGVRSNADADNGSASATGVSKASSTRRVGIDGEAGVAPVAGKASMIARTGTAEGVDVVHGSGVAPLTGADKESAIPLSDNDVDLEFGVANGVHFSFNYCLFCSMTPVAM
jgi:hypothetical protein